MKKLQLLLTVLMAYHLSMITSMAQNFKFDEVTYTPQQTTFRLFAPADAKKVVVRIYKDGQGGKTLKTIKMTLKDGLWTATAAGDLMDKFYTFDMGRGECPGVFAKAVGVNGKRGAIIDKEKTFPEHWCCDVHPVIKSPADLVIYELHHRDFSIARPDAKYPGKFDYGSVDETRLSDNKYNWGYDPVNYNVPEGGYSTNPYDPYCRIREFKEMVNALHEAGIAVILDVVYNHTYDIEHSNFQRTYPDYYYRKTADGQYSNGSGCGNETASDQPMMRQFMIESVKYWYNEYRVDGFRFDLMGCHDIETMNAIRAELNQLNPSILIYGEGWSAGQCALPNEKLGMKANIPQMPGIAAFSDEMRDALRGPFSDDTVSGWLGRLNTNKPGQFAGDVEVESLKFGIVGGISHPQVNMKRVNYSQKPWALEPTQMLAYVSCHDDMCLVDRLKASIPKLSQDELIRLDLLAQTAVFTSQGVPFMLSGEELLRTKQGVHNSFESPDSINRLDWGNKERYPQVFKYYSDLIALRRNHPAFRLGDANLVRKHLEFLDAPSGVVAFMLKNYAGRDDWRNIIVILNPKREVVTVNIPKAMYTVVCKDGAINEDSTEKIFGRRTTVSPQSALILHD